MADNIPITPGSGATVAADTIATVSYQRVKIDNGVDGVVGGDVCSTNPLPITTSGNGHLTASPTVTAGAYTTGQVVGGLITLTSAIRNNGGSGAIQSVQVTVETALTAPYDVIFFDTNPSNSTFTDNSALAVNVADLPFMCGTAHCTDVVSLGTPQSLQALNINIPFSNGSSNASLYAVIVIRGGQTFASTSAIQLSVVVAKN